MVYKWGTLAMVIKCLKGENSKYEGGIELLKKSINGLRIKSNSQLFASFVEPTKKQNQNVNIDNTLQLQQSWHYVLKEQIIINMS